MPKNADSKTKSRSLTPEEVENFRASVMQRIRPESLDFLQRSGMTLDVFFDMVGAIWEVTVETPTLRIALIKSKPATAPQPVFLEDIQRDYEAVAKHDPSMTVSRALTKGLAEYLTESINRGCPAEAYAWRTAIHCGACGHFNETQTLPGYDKAVATVNRALDDVGAKHDWQYFYKKGLCAASLRMALLMYWLPLGLWAMSRSDALKALKLLAAPMRYNQRSPEDKATMGRINPELVQQLECEVLSKLKHDLKASHTHFSKEVSLLGLYRQSKPLVRLERTGQTTNASPAQKHKQKRESENHPPKWRLVSTTGAVLTRRW